MRVGSLFDAISQVRTEMSLHVLAYNLKRVIAILGPQPLMEAMRAWARPRLVFNPSCR